MKSYLKILSIATAGVFLLGSGASFATDPAEVEQMQADCMAKAEEMQAANLPDAEQALEDCLAKVEEMKAGGEEAPKTD
jgi:hypothetical protein